MVVLKVVLKVDGCVALGGDGHVRHRCTLQVDENSVVQGPDGEKRMILKIKHV